MKPTPTFLSLNAFCTSGTRTSPNGARLLAGYQYTDKPPAEEHNYLFGQTIDNVNTGSGGVTDLYTELNGALTTFGITPNASVTNQFTQMLYKGFREYGKTLGEIFALDSYVAPVAWAADGSTMTTYFPAVCLTNIVDYADITTTNYPDLVPYLRGKQFAWKQAMAGEINTWSVTNWSITTNVATLTFANNTADGQEVWLLLALLEDYNAGSGSTYRTITLPAAIGNIPIGTYQVTSISTAARQVTFAVTASNGSGSGTWSINIYPHRLATADDGTGVKARLFNARGFALHGVQDANSYFVGGLRRRDEMQGHQHTVAFNTSGTPSSTNPGSPYNVGSGANTTTSIVTNGTDGAPRTSKTTHSPALPVNLYIHAQRYI